MKKKLKIEFASQTAIDALQPYVEEVLEAIAEAATLPGAKFAFVTDESVVSCFLDGKPTGKKTKHPLDGRKKIDVCTWDTLENQKIVTEISKKLQVTVGIYDYIYEIAIKLRDK